MKLLFCRKCEDIRRVTKEITICRCGRSSAQYEDDLNAWYFGPAKLIGFANMSFIRAFYADELNDPPKQPGDNGEKFDAFFIPRVAPSVRKIEDKDLN